MITLRGDLSDPAVKKAVKAMTGVAVPGLREIRHGDGVSVAWMSPDELLVLCGYDQAGALVATLEAALGAAHSLVVNVSDARAVFTLSGVAAREVVAKLAPVDMAVFKAGEIRRTRLAQVPAAFWMTDGGDGAGDITIVVFRSVAQYVFDLLETAAAKGGEVGFIR
jgi:sarcosine oxidase subunit gamma